MGAAALAALSMVGVLVMVLLSIVGRQLNFNMCPAPTPTPATDGRRGLPGAGAHLKRNEHIRVTLLLQHLRPRTQRGLEIWALFAAACWPAVRLYACAWPGSWDFHDISTGNDATPLWIAAAVDGARRRGAAHRPGRRVGCWSGAASARPRPWARRRPAHE
jgi:hypothetical protein